MVFLVTNDICSCFQDQWENKGLCLPALPWFSNWYGVLITHKIPLPCIDFGLDWLLVLVFCISSRHMQFAPVITVRVKTWVELTLVLCLDANKFTSVRWEKQDAVRLVGHFALRRYITTFLVIRNEEYDNHFPKWRGYHMFSASI
jgi:hypothetical protein